MQTSFEQAEGGHICQQGATGNQNKSFILSAPTGSDVLQVAAARQSRQQLRAVFRDLCPKLCGASLKWRYFSELPTLKESSMLTASPSALGGTQAAMLSSKSELVDSHARLSAEKAALSDSSLSQASVIVEASVSASCPSCSSR